MSTDHLALVVGGLSSGAEFENRENGFGEVLRHVAGKAGRRRRMRLGGHVDDVELEQQILQITREMGIGAQFGGKYFCHDVRVIRLPRHGASCQLV